MSIHHSLDELDERTQREFASIARDGEQFVVAVTAVDGLHPTYHTRLILTDERFLTIRNAPLTQEISRYSLHALSNITLDNFSRYNLKVRTMSNGTIEYPVPPEFGEEFVNEVQKSRGHMQPPRRSRLTKYLHMGRVMIEDIIRSAN